MTADAELLRIHEVALEPSGPATRPLGARPVLDSVTSGSASTRGECVRFRPAAFTAGELTATLAVTVPPGGVLVTAGQGGADVRLRRFAESFPAGSYGRMAPSSSASLRIGRDLDTRPWHLQLTSQGRVSVCGLR